MERLELVERDRQIKAETQGCHFVPKGGSNWDKPETSSDQISVHFNTFRLGETLCTEFTICLELIWTILGLNRTSLSEALLECSTWIINSVCVMLTRFGPKVGQIGPKWDKYPLWLQIWSPCIRGLTWRLDWFPARAVCVQVSPRLNPHVPVNDAQLRRLYLLFLFSYRP